MEVALRIGGEVVSADSMLVYRHMNIGTAKPTISQQRNVPHHLIDIIEPHEQHSVAMFVSMAKEAIEDIHRRGKLPILVGGTGFYIKHLIYNNKIMLINETTQDEDFRRRMQLIANEKGVLELHNILVKIDSEAASRIHPNNVKRVIRALEHNYITETKFSDNLPHSKSTASPYDLIFYVISACDRSVLYERINNRVDSMIASGLVAEVRSLLYMGVSPEAVSMQGVGYKEVVAHLLGGVALAEAVENVKRNTRKLAKRQITWFKHQAGSDCNWKYIDVHVNKCIIDNILVSVNTK